MQNNNPDIISLVQNTSMSDGDPAPTSPGSLVNQYALGEEQAKNTKDLFITVDTPESHVTAIETFITYRVETTVS